MSTQVHLSTTYHPQAKDQNERTIQILEVIMRICTIEYEDSSDFHLPLVEFAYNNSYHASIGMV